MTDLKRGDRRKFGTYWTFDGPKRIDIEDWVWDGDAWVMGGSPVAQRIAIELRPAHKVMTPEEYIRVPIIGWHEVCRDVDGFGGVGIRYLGE